MGKLLPLEGEGVTPHLAREMGHVVRKTRDPTATNRYGRKFCKKTPSFIKMNTESINLMENP